MDKQREGFEKAYEPNPNKSPFTEVKFDEVARVYKPLDQFNPRIASSLNAAWYGWRIRQAEVDGLQAKVEELQTLYTQQGINMLKLQKRVDAVKGLIEDLNKCYQQDHQNKFEYWRGFADSAGILGKRLEQALKGEG
ncbi:hypothetical protein [Acinetobacter baumannii]|uniref:hypothetical protein n=1 Tax=Acinetobacter baumannii TaxID=470 RepID=UPI00338D62CE